MVHYFLVADDRPVISPNSFPERHIKTLLLNRAQNIHLSLQVKCKQDYSADAGVFNLLHWVSPSDANYIVDVSNSCLDWKYLLLHMWVIGFGGKKQR